MDGHGDGGMTATLVIGKLLNADDVNDFLVKSCCLTRADLHCFTGFRTPPNICDVIGGFTNFTVTGGAWRAEALCALFFDLVMIFL